MRSLVSPLLPVLLTLAVAALILNLVFVRVFPPPDHPAAPAVPLVDVTAESGVRFMPYAGDVPARTTLGGGVIVFDANEDGALDLFFANGAATPGDETLDKRPGRGPALFRNDGRGRFTDVTAASGLDLALPGMGGIAGDFDADGRTDLFLTGLGQNRLFRNVGGGRFEDITEDAGVRGEATAWNTGAAWIDTDGDGQLDLVVVHYARWPSDVSLDQAFAIAELGRSYGAPAGFTGSFPTVYQNLGGGRFAPRPDAAGLRDIDPDTGRPVPYALAVAPLDANDDGRLDLLFTYHLHPPALFLARADGRFERAPRTAERAEGTVALLAGGMPAAEAGVGDPRAQVLSQLAHTPAEEADLTALRTKLGFVAADFDHDGRLEVFSGEADAERRVGRSGVQAVRPQVPSLLRARAARWESVPPAPGSWSAAIAARGVATGDLDGDGDADVVLTQHGGAAVVLRNDQRDDRPWLRLRLTATRTHPEAAGARVEVHTPRGILRRVVAPALGLLAQSDATLDFGLGDDARVRRVVIRWPSGQVQELTPPAQNRTHEVREPN